MSQRSENTGQRVADTGAGTDIFLLLRILTYLKPSIGLVIVAIFLLIGFSASSLAGPLITRIAIDRYITQSDYNGLVSICLVWFAFLGITAALNYAQIVVTNTIGQTAMFRLREEIYGTLHHLPIAYFDRTPVGRLVTRVTNDVEVLNQLFTQGVVAIFGDLFIIIGIMIALILLDARLAVVAFATLPVIFIISLQFRKTVRSAFRDIRAALAKINTYLQENFGGIEVVKAFCREAANMEEFRILNATHRDAFLRSVRAFSVYFPLVELVQSTSIALIVWYGSGKVMEDTLTIGVLVAFIQYVGRFFRPIRDLSDKYNILQEAMASSERIFDLIDTGLEPEGPPLPSSVDISADIRFNGVSFSYDGKTPVLCDVTIDFPAGKTTAIVGATGAGKTTLVDLMSRFYDPTDGSILMGGVDIRDIPVGMLRRTIAKVEQEVFLFSGTVEDNITLFDGNIPMSKVHESIKTTHADRLIERFSDGMEHEVTERGSTFSAGERQLIGFSRALAFDRPVLILDEATASVDSETEALIQDALIELLKDRTAIVIAHRLSTIMRADKIVVLHHGRVCQEGSHEELLKRGGIYARLYGLQFAGRGTAGGRSRE